MVQMTKADQSAVKEVSSQQDMGYKEPIISLRNVVKTYKSGAGEFTALNRVNLDIYPGEYVVVLGKSGAGKSTLVNMISGVDHITSGEVYVLGTPIHEMNESQMAMFRGLNMGVVFQFFQLLPMLSILDNIMLPMDFCKLYKPRKSAKRALELLQQVELEDHAKKLPSAISGGQQQRVAITRALANDPPIIIADEPTGSLDSVTAERVFEVFDELVHRGKTIIMVTHDASMAKRATRTLLIADGEIVDEYIVRALPTLSQKQMLESTHKLQQLHYAPGEIVIQEGDVIDQLYIISSGQAEVVIKDAKGDYVVVTQLKPGQYFGEIELLSDDKSIATVRASTDGPLALSTLDKTTFLNLLSESKETRDIIAQTAQTRTSENINGRK